MALADILKRQDYNGTIQELTEERIEKIKPVLKQYIAYWREYPDMFVDYLVGENPENFHLFFYQRIMLRAIFRYKNSYITCPRAMGKSFISMLALMIKCVLYPRAHVSVSTGGKIIYSL